MNITYSRKNYNPVDRHWGLVDDIDTVPGGWDLSSMPVPEPIKEVASTPVIPLETPGSTKHHPRLLWLVDPFLDYVAVPCYPYFAPF